MQVIAGFDPLDPGQRRRARSRFPRQARPGRAGPAARPAALTGSRRPRACRPKRSRAIDDAAQTLAKLGATIEEIELPDYELYNACGRVILTSEAYAIHEKDLQTRPLDYGLLHLPPA